mmetsp:Transcript_50561/g.88072  ORF Transcript_50561/g.88072 Transcript_50561/m.88072 type:complete len:375 (+) Transcript_50561:63-1187(+)
MWVPMLRPVALLSLFACAGHARRILRAEKTQTFPDSAPSTLEAFAALILGNNTAAAYRTVRTPNSNAGRSPPLDRMALARAGRATPRMSFRCANMQGELLPCSIDCLEACSQQQLELLYVDTLSSYYQDKKSIINDEQYAELVDELNWQGSGFAHLRRNEIALVRAAIAFAKGKPIVDDKQWEEMKRDVKATIGKRRDVTKFLTSMRSLRQTAATRRALSAEFADDGIEVSVGPTGVSCTFPDESNALNANEKDVLEMYMALSIVPTGLSIGAWALLALFLGGFDGLMQSASYGIPAAGVVSYLATRQIIKYTELARAQSLKGQCPCCGASVKYMATRNADKKIKLTCKECFTDLEIDVDKREISKTVPDIWMR